jgi:hypothetical protein
MTDFQDDEFDIVGGRMKMKQDKTIRFKAPKPFTRKPIKPRQAHKIATRYDRKSTKDFDYDS